MTLPTEATRTIVLLLCGSVLLHGTGCVVSARWTAEAYSESVAMGMTRDEVRARIGDPSAVHAAMSPESEAWEYRFAARSGVTAGQVTEAVLGVILVAAVVTLVVVAVACCAKGGGGVNWNLGGFGGGGGGGGRASRDAAYRFKVYFGTDGRVTRVSEVKVVAAP